MSRIVRSYSDQAEFLPVYEGAARTGGRPPHGRPASEVERLKAQVDSFRVLFSSIYARESDSTRHDCHHPPEERPGGGLDSCRGIPLAGVDDGPAAPLLSHRLEWPHDPPLEPDTGGRHQGESRRLPGPIHLIQVEERLATDRSPGAQMATARIPRQTTRPDAGSPPPHVVRPKKLPGFSLNCDP